MIFSSLSLFREMVRAGTGTGTGRPSETGGLDFGLMGWRAFRVRLYAKLWIIGGKEKGNKEEERRKELHNILKWKNRLGETGKR
jgi:hypothetical protein